MGDIEFVMCGEVLWHKQVLLMYRYATRGDLSPILMVNPSAKFVDLLGSENIG